MKNVIIVCLLAAVACTYSLQAAAKSSGNNLNFIVKDNVASLHSLNDAPYDITPLELKPILDSNQGVQLAAVCSITDPTCSNIGFNSGDNDINLDNSAQCRDEGFGTSCSSGYVPDTSQKCPYNGSFFKCRVCSHTCSSGSLAYCSSSQVEIGTTKNDCGETCYQCRAKTCEEGGYASSLNSCQKGTPVSFAGKTCYSGVTSKTCADGGHVSSMPTNTTCSSTSYCGNTCYTGCYTPSCSAGGYLNSCPAGQVGTSLNYYGQTCYYGCYSPCTNNCNSGYSFSACNANQVQTGNYSNDCGNKCYACRAKTCADGGHKSSVPLGQSCSSISYAGLNCFTGCFNPDCNVIDKTPTCTAGCKKYNSCSKCIECNVDTATVCANKGFSASTYCSSSEGMDTSYCPENSAYKKCVFNCATYKSHITALITQFKKQAQNSYENACGKYCFDKPIWPRDFCESEKNELDDKAWDYKTKCGEYISAFFSCPSTSCRDGMLGIDMCGFNEMDR